MPLWPVLYLQLCSFIILIFISTGYTKIFILSIAGILLSLEIIIDYQQTGSVSVFFLLLQHLIILTKLADSANLALWLSCLADISSMKDQPMMCN